VPTMLSEIGLAGVAAFAAFFVATLAVGYLLAVREDDDHRAALDRLRRMSRDSSPLTVAPKLATRMSRLLPMLGAMVSAQRGQVAELRTRLMRAGYFQASAPQVFLGLQLLLTVALSVLGALMAWWIGPSRIVIMLFAAIGCGTGYLGPSYLLSAAVARRQRRLRSGFADALDMLVLSLEGGITFSAGLQHLTDNLQTAHSELAVEMTIVQREMQLGLSAGDAIRKFGDRCGLTDVRDLAIVLVQSERYGASLSKALRAHADNARLDRQQQAEETAQKAAVKVLFPTLLFIFPAIFIVVLGPAAFQMAKLFSR
jgi:tight adherence protein C